MERDKGAGSGEGDVQLLAASLTQHIQGSSLSSILLRHQEIESDALSCPEGTQMSSSLPEGPEAQ